MDRVDATVKKIDTYLVKQGIPFTATLTQAGTTGNNGMVHENTPQNLCARPNSRRGTENNPHNILLHREIIH